MKRYLAAPPGGAIEDSTSRLLEAPEVTAASTMGDSLALAHGLHHGNEVAAPVVDGKVDLLVIVAGVRAAVHEQEAELAGVAGGGEVLHGHVVRMVPAGSGGIGLEVVAESLAGGDGGRTFFDGTVIEGFGAEAVPVDEVRAERGVGDVQGDGAITFEL